MEQTNLIAPDGYHHGPVGTAFGLTYAAYHVLAPRTLQYMPVEWQPRFVAIVGHASSALPDRAFPRYQVTLMEEGTFDLDHDRQYRLMGAVHHMPAVAAPIDLTSTLAGAITPANHCEKPARFRPTQPALKRTAR